MQPGGMDHPENKMSLGKKPYLICSAHAADLGKETLDGNIGY
jgi:hypothetical protein